jgi:acetylornithine deacetylase
MGRTVSGEIHYEHRVTDYLESLFHSLGLAYERFPVSPMRDNIIVRVDGAKSLQKGGKLLMLEAHQDTVPVDGMTIDPFDPKVEGGKSTDVAPVISKVAWLQCLLPWCASHRKSHASVRP